jgi:hypothetical protein
MTVYRGDNEMIRYDLQGAVLGRARRSDNGWVITTTDGAVSAPIPDRDEAARKLAELD